MALINCCIFFITIYLSMASGSLFSSDIYPIDKGRHVIDNGERQPGDERIYSETKIEKGQKWPPKRVGNEYCYPPKGSNEYITITEYKVMDMDTGSKGGLAFEVSGGVGQSQVCVFIKTLYGRSYRYKIDVYGFKKNLGNSGGPTAGGFGVPGPAGFGGSGNAGYGPPNPPMNPYPPNPPMNPYPPNQPMNPYTPVQTRMGGYPPY